MFGTGGFVGAAIQNVENNKYKMASINYNPANKNPLANADIKRGIH
jgi:hypothetical protein